MKKDVKEMAKDLTSSAMKPFTHGIFKTDDMDLKSVIIDFKEYFIDNKYTFQEFRTFCHECDKLGFDVLPIEQSHLAIMTHLHGKKLVIQEKAKS